MKSVVAALCTLLLLTLLLPLAASLLVSVPAVQNALVQRLTSHFSNRLGTKVSIDRIDIKLINHVEVGGFCVEDFGGDTLLYIRRLEAPVIELGLVGEPLTFGRVKLRGAQLWLRRGVGEDQMNISRLVDAIRGDKPSNPDSRFRMRIMAIEADSLTFGLVRPDREPRAEGVDFSRFVVRNAHAEVVDFDITGDVIGMNINSLGGDERSGLHIDDLSAHPLTVSRGAVTLSRVGLRSRGSDVRLPAIRLESPDRVWDDFGEFTDSVSMDITMLPSRLTTDLLGAFVPAVADWGVTLDDVSLHARGAVAALSGEIESARTLGTTFSLGFTSRGLPDFEKAYFDADLRSLTTDGGDIGALVRSVTGKELTEDIPAILERLGAISLTGEFKGRLGDFAAVGTLASAAGNADADVKVKAGDTAAVIDGRLSAAGFELGRMLGVEDLGAVSGEIAAAGTLDNGELHGKITELGFRDYTYSGLTFDTTHDGGEIGAKLRMRDPALTLDLEGTLDLGTPAPKYSLDLDLERADLARMHFAGDSISVLSGRLMAEVSGIGLDDMNGTVELRDARYRSPGGEVKTALATLSGRNSATGKLISLRSEFADGDFRSRTGYRDMFAYLGGFLQKYIPLQGFGEAGERLVPPDGGDPVAMSNYSIVSLNVKNTERLLGALAPTASIAEGSSARFMFNPYTGSFSLSARSEFVEYGGMLAANIEITSDNASDSLTLYLSGTDIYSRRGHIPRFALHGGAKGRQQVDISLDDRVWHITADSVNYAAGRVAFDNLNIFSADNPGQRLTATGTASRLPGDTLHMQLNRFDLSLVDRLLRGRKFDVSGLATGWLDVSSALSNPGIDADIELRALAAGGHTAPPLRFTSRRDDIGEEVRFRLRNETSGADLLLGSLSPRGEIDASVRIDSLDAALLDPLLGDILENTQGKASARLTLGGTFKNLRMNGTVDVPHLETTVGYTGVRYGVSGARLRFENSVLTLPDTPVSNRLGGEGNISMAVDMSNLRSIGVEIDARIRGMLAFDTGPGDSKAFYGRVFATGSVGISSGRMGTRMNISARSDAGTQFHLPLNAKSNVSWADFVVFADRTAASDTTNVLERKKLAYERRLQGSSGAGRTGPLELNLTASITPAAELHMLIDPNLGQGITARGEGVIDMRINPVGDMFSMTGDYGISSGRFDFSMMDVFNKTFEIAPGSTLRWSGAADDALLSVDGSYRVRTSLLPLIGPGSDLASGRSVPVDCIIRLRERLSDPEITFDISLPSVDAEAKQIVNNAMNTQELKSMQFLSLLTTGSFASGNSITGQGANSGVMTTGAVGFDILTNQLNNFLSSDDYDIYFRYRPQDNFAGTQVDMGFSTGFWDDRLQLEIEGNYVDDRAATGVGTVRASNLAGDVSLTWTIDRAGNMRLKVFSQRIDRLTEMQGMQESGLGIYYKKDFDNLGDIFRRRASRTGDNFSKFATDSVTVKTPRRRKQ